MKQRLPSLKISLLLGLCSVLFLPSMSLAREPQPLNKPLPKPATQAEMDQCALDIGKVEALTTCAAAIPDPRITDQCRKGYEAAFEQNLPFDKMPKPSSEVYNEWYLKGPDPGGWESAKRYAVGTAFSYAADGVATAGLVGLAKASGMTVGQATVWGVTRGHIIGWVTWGAIQAGLFDSTVCNAVSIKTMRGMNFLCSMDSVRPEHLGFLAKSDAEKRDLLNLEKLPSRKSGGEARDELCKSFREIAETYKSLYQTKITCNKSHSTLEMGEDPKSILRYGFNSNGQPLIQFDREVGVHEPKSQINLMVPDFIHEWKRSQMANPGDGTPFVRMGKTVSTTQKQPMASDMLPWLLRPKMLKIAEACGLNQNRRDRDGDVPVVAGDDAGR